MTRTERLAALLLFLQSRRGGSNSVRITANEIAAHFGISRRTVLRDMAALSVMGIPLESADGAAGGYALPPDFTLAPLPLTHRETLLLLFALGGLERLSVAPFGEARETLTAKLRAMLSPAQLAVADGWRAALSIDVPERSHITVPFLDTILTATHRGGWLATVYHSESGGESEHTLLPRHVSTNGGLWYLRAWSHERRAERTFRIDRFVSVAPTDAPTDSSAHSPDRSLPYNHPSHPEVRVHLTPAGVAIAEREQHVSDAVRRAANGSGEMMFRCPPSELDYWARYFFAMGVNALILGPGELRQRVRSLAEKVAALYTEQ